jgi:hypothetical protein
MKRKEAVYKGLEFIDVLYNDTSLTSPDFFQISEFPLRLTAGKNLFKLRGNPTNLKVGSYLNIEVLDYNGDPIYSEVIDYLDEDKSRVVAIYIYENTSPGDCRITLIGEAVNAPSEWQNRANVKWTRTVPVNPNIANDTEIIFETLPTITLSEQVGVQLDRVYANNTQFPTYNTGTVRYYNYNGAAAIEITGGSFTGDMIGGTLTVATPQNPSPTPNYTVSNAVYQTTIKKILSPSLALLNTEYTVFSSQSISSHTYTAFDYSAYSVTYEATPQYVPTQNSESFALIQIDDLEPATGDISRIKTFVSNNGTIGSWELINDVELEETEIFVSSTSSLYPYESLGLFYSQSVINTYWEGHTYQGKTEIAAPVLTWTTASINNAMRISSSVNIDAVNTITTAELQSAYNGIFIKDASYKVMIDALGTRTGTTNPKISVYLSGSAFNFNTTDYFNQDFSRRFGKRVGELEVQTNNQRFDDETFEFTADNTGTGVLIFIVESGEWQVSDVRTTSDNESGYTPQYTRLRSLVPTPHKADNQVSFKVEYYNIAGEKSKQINYIYNKNWEGGNRYIDGDYSMLTGSLYVADSLETGVAISGYKNTGYIRSLGYEGFTAGFPGFLMWSGSALSGSLGTKGGVPYSGVGLELYGDANNYFRYSTNPSELDVHTETFFFGDPNSQYISGSNGNLEISSSGFYLTADGDVTASSFIAVNGSNVLFDSNSEFVDGFNVGRVVYFDRSEFTASGNFGSNGTPVTSSIFETFILPGETRMQISVTAQFINSASGNRTLSGEWYIQSASSIDLSPLTNEYDMWSTPKSLSGGSVPILFTPVTSIRGNSRTLEVVGGTVGKANFAECQGKYVRIYMLTSHAGLGSGTSEFKLKHFVYRTSRVVGSVTGSIGILLPEI